MYKSKQSLRYTFLPLDTAIHTMKKVLLYIFLLTPSFLLAQWPPDSIYMFVDERPTFPGGDMKMIEYFQHVRATHLIDSTNTCVTVAFVITKSGKVTDVIVVKSASKELDAVIVNAIENMPDWIPGKNKSEMVNTRVTLPICLELK